MKTGNCYFVSGTFCFRRLLTAPVKQAESKLKPDIDDRADVTLCLVKLLGLVDKLSHVFNILGPLSKEHWKCDNLPHFAD